MITDLPPSVINMFNITGLLKIQSAIQLLLKGSGLSKSFLNYHGEFCAIISDHTKLSLKKKWHARNIHFLLDNYPIFLHNYFLPTHPRFVSLTGVKSPCVYGNCFSRLQLNSLA